MSRGLGSKFRKFYFSPIPILNFRKVTKFGEFGSRTKELQAKSKTRDGKRPHPPSANRIKVTNHITASSMKTLQSIISIFQSGIGVSITRWPL